MIRLNPTTLPKLSVAVRELYSLQEAVGTAGR